MGSSLSHDAPPPPGWGFVAYLAALAFVGLFVGLGIQAIAPQSFLFVLGVIAFVAPLLGWSLTLCFGKFMPRKGDFLPVGMLFISFLCGATIFYQVVLKNYDPNYGYEWRFNWFSIAGDNTKDSQGLRTLDDFEYASRQGASLVSEKARQHIISKQKTHELEASITQHSKTLLAAYYHLQDRFDAPKLSSFAPFQNYRGYENFEDLPPEVVESALASFHDLPQDVRFEYYFWLLKAQLQEGVELLKHERNPHANHVNDPLGPAVYQYQAFFYALEELASEIENYEQENKVALEKLQANQNRNKNSAEPIKFETALQNLEPAEKALLKLRTSLADLPGSKALLASAPDHDALEDTPPVQLSGEKLMTILRDFADAKQAIHSYEYQTFDDPNKLDFIAKQTNLRKAPDPLFQAFAIGIFIDNITAVVLLMVTLLAFLIHLFSIGYMHGEIRYTRFMATINLFTAGMIGLVLANNFLWLFICWEIMGLCSYLLIGHYFEKRSAQEASMKAFFTTRIADTFMFVGMMMIFTASGTFVFTGGHDVVQAMQQSGSYMGHVEYAGLGSIFDHVGTKWLMLGGAGATIIGILCFLGPAGKSAQFPFHVWLPDAMEGPTPVSAMIHAACMVSAGVYLTVRLFPLFTPDVLQVIAVIGGFTALAAGTVGLVQTDLKKVLAYSTISQLGYMFLGVGVGAWFPALFHMLTHAFFKALMFLGSGSVILGCHHEQEMSRMGAILKKMPITGITFWVGTLSIIGMPFFFAGFYSKEAILSDAIMFGKSGGSLLPYVFGALGAGLTTFYMLRLMWLTFHGKPKDQHLHDHVKESPWTVTVPLVVIAIGAFIFSWPIGAAKDSATNLGIANIKQHKLAGEEQNVVAPDGTKRLRPAQMPSEFWLSYLWRKSASAYPEAFIRQEYGDGKATPESGELDTIAQLYADKHGRPMYQNKQAWRLHDLHKVDPESFYTDHGHHHEGDDHAHEEAEHHSHEHLMGGPNPEKLLVTTESSNITASLQSSGSEEDSLLLAHAFPHDNKYHDASEHAHDDEHHYPVLSIYSHSEESPIHHYHEKHHHAHHKAFIGSLVALGLGGLLSTLFFLFGPLVGKDWVGHTGFRFKLRRFLFQAYRVDHFYDSTLLRSNRWIRQLCAWFDRTVIDGIVNFFGFFTRKLCAIIAKIDFWGVDGTVRGTGNATLWGGKQVQRSITGYIQDYVFLLVTALVFLYILFDILL